VRAVRNTAEGVRVLDVAAPDGPGVRVRVRSAGICGSDLEMVRTGLAVNTLGHEIAGVTEDGTEVAIHPFVSCGSC
jgi:threonine dehydrogenase-like Zn-dependent dehydrogenase